MNIQPLSSSEDILAAQQAYEAEKKAAAGRPLQPVIVPVDPERSPPAVSVPVANPSQVASGVPATSAVASVSTAATPPAVQIYPTPTIGMRHDVVPHTEPVAQPKLPIGVYIIFGLSLLGAVNAVLASAGRSPIQLVAGVLDGLLAFGLLLRSNLARTLIIIFACLACVGLVLSMAAELRLQHQMHALGVNAHTVLAQDEQKYGTSATSSSLEKQLAAQDAQQQQLDHMYTRAYIRSATNFAAMVIVVVYLLRPKVRAVFH